MNDTHRKRLPWGWWLVVVILWGVIFAILYPMFCTPRTHSPASSCANNLHQIGLAVHQYMGDWDDRLPQVLPDQSVSEGSAWPDALRSHVKTEAIFRCSKSWLGCLTYSYNKLASGLDAKREVVSPSEVVLVFDSVNDSPENNNLNGDTTWRPSDGGVPSAGSLVIWPEREPFWGPKLPKWAKSRHPGTNVLFVDGHSIRFSLDRLPSPESVRFEPINSKEQRQETYEGKGSGGE